MKTIGIIGGLAWPSTLVYYQKINKLVSERLGGHHCAKLVLVQADFACIDEWERQGSWDKVGAALLSLEHQLRNAGADFFLIACTTVHKSLPAIQADLQLHLLHIVECTVEKLASYQKVGLIGSRFTMSNDYFSGPLAHRYGKDVLVPAAEEQDAIQWALKEELAKGLHLERTRSMFQTVIRGLVERGAETIILGCTEFGSFIKSQHCSVPLVDVVEAHVEAAVERAISPEGSSDTKGK